MDVTGVAGQIDGSADFSVQRLPQGCKKCGGHFYKVFGNGNYACNNCTGEGAEAFGSLLSTQAQHTPSSLGIKKIEKNKKKNLGKKVLEKIGIEPSKGLPV